MSRKKTKPSKDTSAEPPEESIVMGDEVVDPPPIVSTFTDDQFQRVAILAGGIRSCQP